MGRCVVLLRRPFRSFLLFVVLACFIFSVPSPAAAAGVPPVKYNPSWVQNFVPTHLWSSVADPGADYGEVPQWSYFLVVAPQTGLRLSVYVPWTKNYAFIDARSVGPSGPPPPDWLAAFMTQLLRNRTVWVGRVVADSLLARQAPSARSPLHQTLPKGTLVQVVAWVMGDELTYGDWTWAKLADGSFAYGEALQIVRPTTPPPVPPDHPFGQWIDVNLLQQTAVAYQDNTPVHLAVVSTGSPGWETTAGLHVIWRRVADETMNGATLSPLGLDTWHAARVGYDLTHVLYTQYIDGIGDALHDNYWLPSVRFGIPHSHGCVGMPVAEALWFWNWASDGVPVLVHAA